MLVDIGTFDVSDSMVSYQASTSTVSSFFSISKGLLS